MVRAMLGASPFIKEPTPAPDEGNAHRSRNRAGHGGARAPIPPGSGWPKPGSPWTGGAGYGPMSTCAPPSPACMPWATRSGRPESCWPMSPPPRGCAPCAIALGMTGGWTIPPCRPGIFTSPEIGCVGLAEAQASEAGRDVRTATFQMRELGKGAGHERTPRHVQDRFGRGHGKVLGVHIAGAHATDLIAEAGLALRLGASVRDIAATIPRPPHLGGGPVRSRAFPRRGWRMKHWGRETLLKKGEPAFPLPQAPPSHSKGFRIYPIPVHGVPKNRFPLGYSAVQIEYIPRKGTSHEKQ